MIIDSLQSGLRDPHFRILSCGSEQGLFFVTRRRLTGGYETQPEFIHYLRLSSSPAHSVLQHSPWGTQYGEGSSQKVRGGEAEASHQRVPGAWSHWSPGSCLRIRISNRVEPSFPQLHGAPTGGRITTSGARPGGSHRAKLLPTLRNFEEMSMCLSCYILGQFLMQQWTTNTQLFIAHLPLLMCWPELKSTGLVLIKIMVRNTLCWIFLKDMHE